MPVAPKTSSGCLATDPEWAAENGQKTGDLPDLPAAFRYCSGFKKVQQDRMIYESINGMQILLKYSSWRRKGILEITIEIMCVSPPCPVGEGLGS